MKIFKSSFTAVLLMAYVLVQSQATYDYAKFRFPDVKVKGLSGSINLSGNDYSNGEGINKTENKAINYRVLANYFQFENSLTNQKTSEWNLNHSYSKESNPEFFNPRKKSKETIFFNLNRLQINRKYLDHNFEILGFKQKFIEFNQAFGVIYNQDYTETTNSGTKKHSIDYSANIPLKLGVGRIEPISDVFLAQFLMDDLLAAGLIAQKFTEDQLFDLAQLLSRIRNQRVFDFRRARVYQLTEIANWLEQNGIPQNIQTFTIINDNWQSALINQRKQGKRIAIGLAPWGSVQKTNFEKFTNYGLAIEVEYNYAMPLSQYFQADFLLSLSQDYQYYRNIEDRLTILSFGFKYAYNPNSRTTFAVGPESNIVMERFSQINYLVNLPASANYFINNRARISVFAGMFYQYYPNFITHWRKIVSDFSTSVNDNVLILTKIFPKNLNNGTHFELYGNVTFNYAFF